MTNGSSHLAGSDPDPASLLGAADPDDWKLEPQEHARRLLPEAAALKRVLEDEAIKAIMRAYERHDESAANHQSRYKRLGKWEIYLGTAAALLGAIILSMTDSQNLGGGVDAIRKALLLVQIFCAAGLLGVKYLLQHQNPFLKWQKQRSAAETARIALFETVCGLAGKNVSSAHQPGQFPLLPLQLEYFVRYQLLVQVFYYQNKAKLHQAAADRFVSAGAIITFVAALAVALLGLANEFGDAVSFAALVALVAPILLGTQTSLSRLNQDERNAARYRITFEHLDHLQGELGEVRAAARGGLADKVHEYIRRVDQVISVEHSQWLSQQSEAATDTQTHGGTPDEP